MEIMDNFNYTAVNTYICWIDIDSDPLVEDQNDQVTKDAKQKQNLKERNKLSTERLIYSLVNIKNTERL